MAPNGALPSSPRAHSKLLQLSEGTPDPTPTSVDPTFFLIPYSLSRLANRRYHPGVLTDHPVPAPTPANILLSTPRGGGQKGLLPGHPESWRGEPLHLTLGLSPRFVSALGSNYPNTDLRNLSDTVVPRKRVNHCGSRANPRTRAKSGDSGTPRLTRVSRLRRWNARRRAVRRKARGRHTGCSSPEAQARGVGTGSAPILPPPIQKNKNKKLCGAAT